MNRAAFVFLQFSFLICYRHLHSLYALFVYIVKNFDAKLCIMPEYTVLGSNFLAKVLCDFTEMLL